MFALVTGVAGFIGSHVAELLLTGGWDVRGIDSFVPYYDPATKRTNVLELSRSDHFDMVEGDLCVADLETLLSGVDVVFHLAAQPGVRDSWSHGFGDYTTANIDVTQRLLEACRQRPLRRFVYSSSSSIYGNAERFPVPESAVPRPYSPYGITKLAGEHLCQTYHDNFDTPTTVLRYFTVYGPRQRPDMAIHRMMEAALSGRPFQVFGDGSQVRDYTYVGDVAAANVLAAEMDVDEHLVLNIAGGESGSLAQLLDLVGRAVGAPVPVVWTESTPGDVARTGGATARAAEVLDWTPRWDLEAGLAAQAAWHRSRS